MSLELLDARQTPDGIAMTFATEHGIESLFGSCDQVARLAKAMQQVSALAPLHDSEGVWLEDVEVGDDVVKLGLSPGGEARVRIDRAAARSVG
jgi:hypothetical protein